jgi:hypothetical protein
MGLRRLIIVKDITWLKQTRKQKDPDAEDEGEEAPSGIDLEP